MCLAAELESEQCTEVIASTCSKHSHSETSIAPVPLCFFSLFLSSFMSFPCLLCCAVVWCCGHIRVPLNDSVSPLVNEDRSSGLGWRPCFILMSWSPKLSPKYQSNPKVTLFSVHFLHLCYIVLIRHLFLTQLTLNNGTLISTAVCAKSNEHTIHVWNSLISISCKFLNLK